jgi:hypothetical protein
MICVSLIHFKKRLKWSGMQHITSRQIDTKEAFNSKKTDIGTDRNRAIQQSSPKTGSQRGLHTLSSLISKSASRRAHRKFVPVEVLADWNGAPACALPDSGTTPPILHAHPPDHASVLIQ